MTRVMRTAATGTTVPDGMSESEALKLLAIATGRVELGQTKPRKTTTTTTTKEKIMSCTCSTTRKSTGPPPVPDSYGLTAAREKAGPTRSPWRHTQAARGTQSAFDRELDAFVQKQAKESRAAATEREQWSQAMARFAPPQPYGNLSGGGR